MQNYAVNAKALESFTKQIFTVAGLQEKDAASVAELLVQAYLRNVRSHGDLRTVP